MNKLIGVVSGKGGVGKTTTAINLGSALNQFGHDVLVADANVSSPNMGTYLGTTSPGITLNDVMMGKSPLKQAVHTHRCGLKTIYSCISFEKIKATDQTKLGEVIKKMKELAEIVIVDGSSGQTEETIQVAKGVDEMIVVSTPDLPSVTDTLRTIRIADEHKANMAGLVLNMAQNDRHEMKVKNVEELTNHKVWSVVPMDDKVRLAANIKFPVAYTYPDSPASIKYKELAAQLIGQKYQHSVPRAEEEKDLISSFLKKVSGQ